MSGNETSQQRQRSRSHFLTRRRVRRVPWDYGGSDTTDESFQKEESTITVPQGDAAKVVGVWTENKSVKTILRVPRRVAIRTLKNRVP